MSTSPPPSQRATQSILYDLVSQGLIGPRYQIDQLSGGRTNLVFRLNDGVRDCVLKQYNHNLGNLLFPNDPEAEVTVLERLARYKIAPCLIAHGEHDTTHWSLYAHQNGAPWLHQVEYVAELLGRVHAVSCASWPLRQLSGGSEDIHVMGTSLLACCPESSQKQHLSEARPEHFVPNSGEQRLLHGDPVPGNLLVNGAEITLIDWQCPAIGDPTHDIAIFLSPAMQLLYRGAPLSKNEVSQFLAAYPDRDIARRYHGLADWFHWRMACYCLLRASQGATDYSQAIDFELNSIGSNIRQV